MKRIVRNVALIAVLGMVTIGCQKEPITTTHSSVATISENTTIHYSIDGNSYSITLHSDAETDAFFLHLTALARQGYNVVVINETAHAEAVATKEIVTFTTIDANEAAEWSKKMTQQGYEVTINYNTQTGVYTCIAVK